MILLYSYSLFIYLLLRHHFIDAFNLDTHAPIYKIGPGGSYFGFAVAEHFKLDLPVVLVGAPKAESGQPGTHRAGAVFSCPLTAHYVNGVNWCRQENVEYATEDEMAKPVGYVHGRQLHFHGKNGQLLGSVVASAGIPHGMAMACAPLVRYHNTSAYTDGTCFVLESDLTQKEMLVSCSQPGLPRIDRHNEFGSCMEGFSGSVDESLVITGLPGAKKWTGGVFGRYYPKDIFAMNQDRWTMGVDPKLHGVRSKFQGHDYLGFSVRHGRFGFWYEDSDNITVVAGATRYNQTGAVTFLPFRKGQNSGSQSSHYLTLTEDSFTLLGTQLGSAFGYSVECTDLNNDGFHDLLVGSPFEYVETSKGSFGGAVYIFYSSGIHRARHENSKVFLPPIKLRGHGVYSQFGLSITKLDNLDGDITGYNDFAVGAPFSENGKGSVYIYLGAKSPETFNTEAAQVIKSSDLPSRYLRNGSLATFGFSLSGGSDLDHNGYADLVVGAFGSDTVVVLRARPVVSVKTRHLETDMQINIDGNGNCTRNAQTCFRITTELFADMQNSKTPAHLLDFREDVFKCILEVVSLSSGVGKRARFVATRNEKYIWNCGRRTNSAPQTTVHELYISDKNSDWVNPIKMIFSVRLRRDALPEMPPNGGKIVDMNHYPILNKFGSEDIFAIPFNKKCGADNVCICDLHLQAVLPGISKEEDGTYVTQIGEKAGVDISFLVTVSGERAYETLLFINYNSDELDSPVLSKKVGAVNIKSFTDNLAQISLGNPVEPGTQLNFEVSFKLARGRTEGLGRPLEFEAYVNSTSKETDMSNNHWEAVVRVIKRAELELSAISDPSIVRYGGDIKKESDMEYDTEIGPFLMHRYTVTNKGPWSVRNVSVQVNWPYQMSNVVAKGKWILYLLETPTIQLANTDNTKELRQCTMALPHEWINPLQLKLYLETEHEHYEEKFGGYSRKADGGVIAESRRYKRWSESRGEKRASRELRIKPIKIKEKSGEEVEIVKVNCADKTAKCFVVTCYFEFLDVDASAEIDFRARLWNATFVEDYYDVTYVEIQSSGRLFLDQQQGIEEKDTRNNYASASTHAYPDRPAIQETAPVPWWIIALAAALGFIILLILILIFWKCGFFKRNRPQHPTLHQAEYQYRQEQWNET